MKPNPCCENCRVIDQVIDGAGVRVCSNTLCSCHHPLSPVKEEKMVKVIEHYSNDELVSVKVNGKEMLTKPISPTEEECTACYGDITPHTCGKEGVLDATGMHAHDAKATHIITEKGKFPLSHGSTVLCSIQNCSLCKNYLSYAKPTPHTQEDWEKEFDEQFGSRVNINWPREHKWQSSLQMYLKAFIRKVREEGYEEGFKNGQNRH